MEDFSENAAWSTECMESYGVDADVPLDPSFTNAVVNRILYNGSVIYTAGQAATAFEEAFDVGGELVIEGRNLTANNFHLAWNDGTSTVMYTPLASTPSSLTFVFSSDGTATLSVDGRFGTERLGTIEISGIVAPAFLPTTLFVGVIKTNHTTDNVYNGQLTVQNSYCINAPLKVADGWPYFKVRVRAEEDDFDLSDVAIENGEVGRSDFQSPDHRFTVVPTDASKPVVVKYDGVIIAVFNYS